MSAWRICNYAFLTSYTVDNLADFFTKPLAKNDFFRMRDILMNVPAADCVAVSRERKTPARGGE